MLETTAIGTDVTGCLFNVADPPVVLHGLTDGKSLLLLCITCSENQDMTIAIMFTEIYSDDIILKRRHARNWNTMQCHTSSHQDIRGLEVWRPTAKGHRKSVQKLSRSSGATMNNSWKPTRVSCCSEKPIEASGCPQDQ